MLQLACQLVTFTWGTSSSVKAVPLGVQSSKIMLIEIEVFHFIP